MDSNHGPSGYEPDELPDCSTPRRLFQYSARLYAVNIFLANFQFSSEFIGCVIN
jgi:hypothetical protein